jgi:hypothetical protein
VSPVISDLDSPWKELVEQLPQHWLLEVPPEYDRRILEAIERYEQENKMPFVTFAERHGLEKGLKQGLEKGREYLLKGIALGLKLKFGSAGLALLPEIEKQQNLDVLEAIVNAIETAASTDDLQRLFT